MNDLICINPACKRVGLEIRKSFMPMSKLVYNKLQVFCPQCYLMGPYGDNSEQARVKYISLGEHTKLP